MQWVACIVTSEQTAGPKSHRSKSVHIRGPQDREGAALRGGGTPIPVEHAQPLESVLQLWVGALCLAQVRGGRSGVLSSMAATPTPTPTPSGGSRVGCGGGWGEEDALYEGSPVTPFSTSGATWLGGRTLGFGSHSVGWSQTPPPPLGEEPRAPATHRSPGLPVVRDSGPPRGYRARGDRGVGHAGRLLPGLLCPLELVPLS